jgi:hypothetical protein
VYAQEVLQSYNEKYYDYLALRGYIERPYLNYRTLSDSVWDYAGGKDDSQAEIYRDGKRDINGTAAYRIYGPELFMSYNTKTPYGQNDGILWQGKGLNSYVSAGGRLEAYGFEATFFPLIAFSQNKAFDLIPPNSAYSLWKEGSRYGYYGIAYVDAPQRFGDDSFYEFSWGDSEIRYSWKTLTIGFGTQNIWLGPAKINPILLSNNAPPYPKLDVGLRKQPVTVFDTYIGDFEGRVFWGRLTESDFFDDDSSNDHNLLTGFSVSYSPAFIEGFTVGLNSIMLSKWNDADGEEFFMLLWPAFFSSGAPGDDERDQRASLSFDYMFPDVGLELYLEWARNDFSGLTQYLRYPFHTQAYTFGARKSFSFFDFIRGEILLELTNLESSRDYELIPWSTTFYAHRSSDAGIAQGHTNRGQWLGAGLGTGGNSQYFSASFFYEKGCFTVFLQRQNIDNDYVWFMDHGASISAKRLNEDKFKTLVSIGANNYINIRKYTGLFSGITYSYILNPTYNNEEDAAGKNLYIFCGIKFIY